ESSGQQRICLADNICCHIPFSEKQIKSLTLDIYLKRKRWKTLLLFVAVLIGLASLLYTNWLTGKMANEERKKVELWAEATKRLAETGIQNGSQAGIEQLNTAYLTLIQSILEQNTTIPVLIVEADGSFNYDANISFSEGRKKQVLSNELEKMKSHAEPIRIDVADEEGDDLLQYYRESIISSNFR